MTVKALFIVSLHLYYSLYINTVYELDEFRPDMTMMDVEATLVYCALAIARELAVHLVDRPPFENRFHFY